MQQMQDATHATRCNAAPAVNSLRRCPTCLPRPPACIKRAKSANIFQRTELCNSRRVSPMGVTPGEKSERRNPMQPDATRNQPSSAKTPDTKSAAATCSPTWGSTTPKSCSRAHGQYHLFAEGRLFAFPESLVQKATSCNINPNAR